MAAEKSACSSTFPASVAYNAAAAATALTAASAAAAAAVVLSAAAAVCGVGECGQRAEPKSP